MATDPEPRAADYPHEPVEDLGRSYGELLGQQLWEVDRTEDFPENSSPPQEARLLEKAALLTDPESAAPRPETQTTPTPPDPLRIIEALLFVGGPPLTAARACEAVRGLTPPLFNQAVDSLNQEYRRQGRPYHIQSQDQGYVLTLRPKYRSVADKLYGSVREARLSAAAIDVLALVAYRQPATKQEIDSLRGVESGTLLRQLVRRNLITIVQRGEANQREVAYGTTNRFLELFGLTSLDDLPRTQDLQVL
jgi:segregation and condensation protein B